mmetsp:Transcript_40032/g.110223  ORF Transcript_40032/g.110223 Transcript_40032/m.110223 type:complete len:1068 (-) Transcript_40032:93-3296(-)
MLGSAFVATVCVGVARIVSCSAEGYTFRHSIQGHWHAALLQSAPPSATTAPKVTTPPGLPLEPSGGHVLQLAGGERFRCKLPPTLGRPDASSQAARAKARRQEGLAARWAPLRHRCHSWQQTRQGQAVGAPEASSLSTSAAPSLAAAASAASSALLSSQIASLPASPHAVDGASLSSPLSSSFGESLASIPQGTGSRPTDAITSPASPPSSSSPASASAPLPLASSSLDEGAAAPTPGHALSPSAAEPHDSAGRASVAPSSVSASTGTASSAASRAGAEGASKEDETHFAAPLESDSDSFWLYRVCFGSDMVRWTEGPLIDREMLGWYDQTLDEDHGNGSITLHYVNGTGNQSTTLRCDCAEGGPQMTSQGVRENGRIHTLTLSMATCCALRGENGRRWFLRDAFRWLMQPIRDLGCYNLRLGPTQYRYCPKQDFLGTLQGAVVEGTPAVEGSESETAVATARLAVLGYGVERLKIVPAHAARKQPRLAATESSQSRPLEAILTDDEVAELLRAEPHVDSGDNTSGSAEQDTPAEEDAEIADTILERSLGSETLAWRHSVIETQLGPGERCNDDHTASDSRHRAVVRWFCPRTWLAAPPERKGGHTALVLVERLAPCLWVAWMATLLLCADDRLRPHASETQPITCNRTDSIATLGRGAAPLPVEQVAPHEAEAPLVAHGSSVVAEAPVPKATTPSFSQAAEASATTVLAAQGPDAAPSLMKVSADAEAAAADVAVAGSSAAAVVPSHGPARTSRKDVRVWIGQVVESLRDGSRGVVVGWDLTPRALLLQGRKLQQQLAENARSSSQASLQSQVPHVLVLACLGQLPVFGALTVGEFGLPGRATYVPQTSLRPAPWPRSPSRSSGSWSELRPMGNPDLQSANAARFLGVSAHGAGNLGPPPRLPRAALYGEGRFFDGFNATASGYEPSELLRRVYPLDAAAASGDSHDATVGEALAEKLHRHQPADVAEDADHGAASDDEVDEAASASSDGARERAADAGAGTVRGNHNGEVTRSVDDMLWRVTEKLIARVERAHPFAVSSFLESQAELLASKKRELKEKDTAPWAG